MLLSAVIEPEIVEDAVGFRGLPVLVVHGRRDNQIPWWYLEKSLAALRRAGAEVVVEANPEEAHFLVFSRLAQVQGWVGARFRGRFVAR